MNTKKNSSAGGGGDYISALEHWARQRTDQDEFLKHNTDLCVCHQHRTVAFKMHMAHTQYKSCQVCTAQPLQSFIIPGSDLYDAQRAWRKVFANKSATADHEQVAWLNYQYYVWLHRHEAAEPQVRNALHEYVQDGFARNGVNVNRFRCEEHGVVGDMIPLRLKASYEDCMVCVKKRVDTPRPS